MAATRLNNWSLVLMRICCDLIVLNMAIFVGFYLRTDLLPLEVLSAASPYNFKKFALVANVSFIIAGFLSRWFFVSVSSNLDHDKPKIAFAFLGLLLGLGVFFVPLFNDGVPRSLWLIVPLCFFLMLGTSRFIAAWTKRYFLAFPQPNSSCWVTGPVAIMGISDDQRDCAQFFKRSSIDVFCFTSCQNRLDSKNVVVKYIDGIPLRALENVRDAIQSGKIKSVVCYKEDMLSHPDFIDECLDNNVAIVRPESIKSRWPYKAIMDIKLDDLFPSRQRFTLDESLRLELSRNYSGKSILVTGGGGSIGGALVKILADLQPKCLVILDNSEYNLYNIQRVLETISASHVACFVYGSVNDRKIVSSIFDNYSIDVVFHAAALKHVAIVDSNPDAGFHVNVEGTELVSNLALDSGVSRFVFVSTDKAVRPTTVMGATKRQAEIKLLELLPSIGMEISVVRFGNVADSSGSVMPAFKESLMRGRGLGITSPTVRRYFMSLEEAASLVVSTVLDPIDPTLKRGIPVYLLDMGEPVMIDQLAKRMINFAGLRWGDHIDLAYTALQFGDKQSEELESTFEQLQDTLHPKIKKTQLNVTPEDRQVLRQLRDKLSD